VFLTDELEELEQAEAEGEHRQAGADPRHLGALEGHHRALASELVGAQTGSRHRGKQGE
jgi:hypothetical protein